MRTGFVHGIATGVAAAAVLVHVWLAIELADYRDTYRDFGGPLPAATRLVLSLPWRWGVPAAGAIAIAGLVTRRPRRLWSYLALALTLASTVVATYYLSQLPLRELAGKITGD